MPDEAPEDRDKKPDAWIVGIQAFAQIFTSLVETFGWPGASVVLGFWFIVWYATAEQKQRIVEIYVLGTGIGRTWPIVVMAVAFAATTLAQRWLYKKKVARLTEEIEREGKAKTALQEKTIATKLQHAQTTTAKPKRK